jgi:hypothetical protein
MQKTVCAACGETGGRFIFRGDKYYHADRCTKPAGMRDTAKSIFPYTTFHISDPNDGPTVVQSLRHLRQLENAHGVASDPFNNTISYSGERY